MLLRRGLTLANTRRVFAARKAPTADALTSGDPQVALRAALESPAPALGLDVRAGAYVLHADAGMRDVRVVVVGDIARAARGRATAVAALYDLDGKPVSAMESVLDVPAGRRTADHRADRAAGALSLRVAVRDAAGHVGSLERPVDARWKKVGAIETPGLVLFRLALGASAPSGLVLDSIIRSEQLITQLSRWPAADCDDADRVRGDAAGERGAAGTTPGADRGDHGRRAVARDALPAVTLPPGRYTMTAKIGTTGLARSFSVPAAAVPSGVPNRRPRPHRRADRDERRSAPASGPPRPAGPARTRRRPSSAAARFSTSTVLAAGFVGPLIDRLAARPERQPCAPRSRAPRPARGRPTIPRTGRWRPAGSPHFVAGLGRLQAGDLDAATRAFPRRAAGGTRLHAGAGLSRRLLCRRGQGSAGRERLADGPGTRALAAGPPPLTIEARLRVNEPAAAS